MRKFELQQLKAKALKEGRSYYEKAESENRQMTAEEQASFQKAMDDIASLDSRVAALEALESAEPDQTEGNPDLGVRSRGMQVETRETSKDLYGSTEYRNAWLYANVMKRPDLAEKELRTVNFVSNANGIYAVTPTQVVSEVVTLVNNLVWMRKFATIYKTTSPTARIPLLTTRMGVAAYGATEITSVTADTTQAFTTRDLTPYVLSALVKVSKLSNNVSNLMSLVVNEIAYAMAVAEETKFMVGAGSGSTEPLGIFTASASGISTGRDVDSGSATSITADAIFTAKYKIKQQYINKNTGWVFHRDAMAIIAKLKASTAGTYLFSAGLNGQADTLVNHPIYLSEYAPNTFTTGLYVGVLGDLSQYAIVDVEPRVELQTLDQLYAATHEIGVIATSFNNGAPQLEEAFSRLKTS